MRYFSAILVLLCFTGCSFLNTFKGEDDLQQNYAAGIIKSGIDKSVLEEVKHHSPNGYLTKPYSRKIWNDYWNSRIFTLYDLGHHDSEKAYRGPTGPEFIRYIIESRRANKLPELKIEERNRDKIPKSSNKALHTNGSPLGLLQSTALASPAQSRMLLPQPPRLRLAPLCCQPPLPESRG